MDADVIIVGAGLAGLRCARTLELSGRRCVLLEASDGVGGRVKSRHVGDALIDEGFQLVNPAYPEIRAAGLDDVAWRRFAPVLRFIGPPDAVLVDPRYAPFRALRSLRSSGLSARDLAGLVRVARAAAAPSRTILADHSMSAREGFRRCGLSEGTLDRVVAPFFSGVLLDSTLDAPWSYVRLLLKSFLKDRPATTPEGLGALPRALARQLRISEIRLNCPVYEVGPTWARVDNGTIRARAVVVATDAHRAQDLVPGLATTNWRSQTTWWWRSPVVSSGAELRLPRHSAHLTSVLDVAAVAPERCPQHSLLAAAGNGLADLHATPEVHEEVARLYDLSPRDLELVDVTRVAHALPVITRGRPHPPRFGDVFLAGDYLTTPSTQGALSSGRRAADAVLAAMSG